MTDFIYIRVHTAKGIFRGSIQASSFHQALKQVLDMFGKLGVEIEDVKKMKRGSSLDRNGFTAMGDSLFAGRDLWVAAGRIAEYDAERVLLKAQGILEND